MKVLIISKSDRTGGAAVAAFRLMQALRKTGIDAQMLVSEKLTDSEFVHSTNTSWFEKQINFLRFCYERWVIFVHNRFSRTNLFAVSIANTGKDISRHPLVQEADIIHLHWINQGFLSINDIEKLTRLNKPIFWTMHDMWACTGICHHARECENFQASCGNCFFLQRPSANDLSHRVFLKKQKLMQHGNIQLIAVSSWLQNRALKSSILKNCTILNVPNPIDTDFYKPQDKISSRQTINLPLGKKLILFAACNISNKRKGIDYFISACRLLALTPDRPEVMLLGGKIDERLLQAIPLKTHILGYINNAETIRAAYSAADVYVTSSLEENLPNTIMEAMACGTPCVGFTIGGIPEMIDHKENGYVAEYENAEDLADGIKYCIENQDVLSKKAREKVLANYSEAVVAERISGCAALYND